MAIQTTDPRAVQLSARFYALLLGAYPDSFKRLYGDPMAQVFGDCARAAYRRTGYSGLIKLWGRTLIDWIKSVVAENTHRETEITREKFIRLAGWALMLGAAVMELGFVIDANWIRVRLYRIYGPPVNTAEYQRYIDLAGQLEFIPIVAGFFCLSLGVLGLQQAFSRQLSEPGRHSLIWSLAGCGLAIAAVLMQFFQLADSAWYGFSSGLALLFGGLAWFGRTATRERLLPARAGLPLLACLWFPLLLVLSFIYEILFPGEWLDFPEVVNAIPMSAAFLSLLLLGFEMQRRKELPAP